MDVELRLVVLAHQVALRQRGPFVGSFGFVADEHQPAGESLLAQGLCRLRAREAGADDHVRLLLRHG